jgi:hypothetical protein
VRYGEQEYERDLVRCRRELSVRGSLRNEVLEELEAAKAEAQRTREAEPYRLAGSERWFLVQGGGRRAYPYVLASADIWLAVRGNVWRCTARPGRVGMDGETACGRASIPPSASRTTSAS